MVSTKISLLVLQPKDLGGFLRSSVMLLSIYNICLFACRRVLIFPKGNNVDQFSMYLDVADSANLPYGWSRYAQFSLAVVNQIQPKYSIRKGTALLHAVLSTAPHHECI